MGRLRSRQGCLTCRKRHVKCDESRPICGQCAKSDRQCEIDPKSLQLQIKEYQGRHTKNRRANSSTVPQEQQSSKPLEQPLTTLSPREAESRWVGHDIPSHAESSPQYQGAVLTPNIAAYSLQGSTPETSAVSPNTLLGYQHLHGVSPLQHGASPLQHGTSPLQHESSPLEQRKTYSLSPSYHHELSQSDAIFLRHFAQHLAAWLDCTDASGNFRLNMTTLARTSPVLLNAVISFAARHMKCDEVADTAQQRCVELLIPHLSRDEVGRDEAVLCAIVILRVCEQLSATSTGSDHERHLSGLSALMKASQAPSELDPSSPNLSQAAFWVYVRQVLYNACVHQQPPNLDFGLVVLPPPTSTGSESIIDSKTETAWANTMTWICALVIRFCFGDTSSLPVMEAREQRWLEMTEMVENWQKSKPSTFEPIWYREPDHEGGNPFPEIWFTSDWHVMAFGFYHLALMLLAIYQAAPRFAIRRVSVGSQDTDAKIMMHARALCGASKSSPKTVPSLITLCHSTFIWGPLMTDERERVCVLKMLEEFEDTHSWPTAWIANALRKEWYRAP